MPGLGEGSDCCAIDLFDWISKAATSTVKKKKKVRQELSSAFSDRKPKIISPKRKENLVSWLNLGAAEDECDCESRRRKVNTALWKETLVFQRNSKTEVMWYQL